MRFKVDYRSFDILCHLKANFKEVLRRGYRASDDRRHAIGYKQIFDMTEVDENSGFKYPR